MRCSKILFSQTSTSVRTAASIDQAAAGIARIIRLLFLSMVLSAKKPNLLIFDGVPPPFVFSAREDVSSPSGLGNRPASLCR